MVSGLLAVGPGEVGHGLAHPVGLPVEGEGGQFGELVGLGDVLFDLGVRQAPAEEPAPGRFEEGGLQGGAAQAGQDAGYDVAGQITGPGERLRVVQGLLDGVVAGADPYGGALTAVDREDGGGQPQVLQGLRQAGVVGEDDDLAVLSEEREDAGETVHLGGVHRLHWVVDDEEPEGVLREEGARGEEGQGEGVQFPLAHHAERGGVDVVDGHVEGDLTLGSGAAQADRAEGDVALLAAGVEGGVGAVVSERTGEEFGAAQRVLGGGAPQVLAEAMASRSRVTAVATASVSGPVRVERRRRSNRSDSSAGPVPAASSAARARSGRRPLNAVWAARARGSSVPSRRMSRAGSSALASLAGASYSRASSRNPSLAATSCSIPRMEATASYISLGLPPITWPSSEYDRMGR